MEIWKDIEGYEGFYKVSTYGRVKSFKYKDERILKGGISTGKYLTVSLSKQNNVKTISVHQLVAIAFLNHVPCGYKIVVDHKDNNPLNNVVDNLQITTQRHNASKDKKGCSSKYTGVFFYKRTGQWLSSISVNGKLKHLGYFNTELEAHKAYQDKLKTL